MVPDINPAGLQALFLVKEITTIVLHNGYVYPEDLVPFDAQLMAEILALGDVVSKHYDAYKAEWCGEGVFEYDVTEAVAEHCAKQLLLEKTLPTISQVEAILPALIEKFRTSWEHTRTDAQEA